MLQKQHSLVFLLNVHGKLNDFVGKLSLLQNFLGNVCTGFDDDNAVIHGDAAGSFFAEQEAASDANRQLIEQLMTLILQWCKEARAAKNWAFADQIRNGLAQLGIQVKDLPDGATAWTKES